MHTLCTTRFRREYCKESTRDCWERRRLAATFRTLYCNAAGERHSTCTRDASSPQLWIYKDTPAPARLIARGGADLRLLQYGTPAAGEWFPRVIELWSSGQLAARFEVLESKGVRGGAEEEEDDSDQ